MTIHSQVRNLKYKTKTKDDQINELIILKINLWMDVENIKNKITKHKSSKWFQNPKKKVDRKHLVEDGPDITIQIKTK